MDLKGRSLGGYVVDGPTSSSGGGGWRARNAETGDAIVYAVSSEGAAVDPARRAEKVHHPAVARVLAQGVETDGTVWLAEELAEGTRLDELLRAHGPLPPARFLPLFERLCDGVSRAHEGGVAHGDIRAERVLVSTREGRLWPKLCGLGASFADPQPGPADDVRALAALAREALESSATLLEGKVAQQMGACQAPAELYAAVRAAVGLPAAPAPGPRLNQALRARTLALAPEPLAEAVAALDAAANPEAMLQAVRGVGRVIVRLLGAIAVAARGQAAKSGNGGGEGSDRMRALRTRALEDREWLELAQDLVRPLHAHPELHPVPELVTFLRDHSDPLERLLSDDNLADAIYELEKVLDALDLFASYRLVVPHGDRGEVWVGIRRSRPLTRALPSPLPEGWPVILDPSGQPALSLYPLVQAAEPAPGAPEEIFVLAGPGRHGARLESLPYGAVLDDDRLWSWFGENLVALSGNFEPIAVEGEPYRGLDPYGTEHARAYFGREREAQSLVNRLRVEPLVTVVGAAGVGKTSLVQAGVLPSLPDHWRAVTVRPGASPLDALARAANVARLPLGDPDALGRALRAAAGDESLLLVVDPFEDLFTLCTDDAERQQAAMALARAARNASDPVRVILVVRDDFLVRVEALSAFRARLARGLHLCATPPADDLLRALVEPARRAGHDFDNHEAAVTMAAEAARLPAGLTHLSLAASELWERRAGGKIPGGADVTHAPQALAERAVAQLSPGERALLPRLLAHLETAERTAARPRWAELGDRANLARRLLAAGVLRVDGDHVEAKNEVILAQLWVAASTPERGGRSTLALLGALIAATALGVILFSTQRGAEDRAEGSARALVAKNAQLEESGAQLTSALIERGRRTLLAGDARGALADLRAARGRGARGPVVDLLVSRATTAAAGEDVLLRHPGKVWMADFSPDGSRLVTAGDDRQARIWDPQTGNLVMTLAGHAGTVWSARFSADGKQVVTGSDDGTARLWDAGDGKQLAALGSGKAILDAELTPGGVVTRGLDGEVRVFAPTGGPPRHAFPGRAMAVSGDRRLGAAGGDDGKVRVFEVESGKVMAELAGGEAVAAVAFSPDGRTLCSAHADHAVRLWDLATRKLAHQGTGHAGDVTSCAFSSDSSRVVSASVDHTARVWHVGSGDLLYTIAHDGEVSRARFSPDGGRLVTASSDGSARLWDASSGRPRGVLLGHEDSVYWVVFDPASGRLATTSLDGTARIWSTARDSLELTLVGHTDAVGAARFSPDGKRLVTGSRDHTARVWDAATGAELVVLSGHDDTVRSVEWSPDGNRIVTASKDGKARVFLAGGGKPVVVIEGGGPLTSARYSPNGARIVTAEEEGLVRLWTASGTAAGTIDPGGGAVDARFSPDGTRLVVAGPERLARIYALDRAPRAVLTGHRLDVHSAAFSPDGARVVTSSADRTARIFSAARGAPGPVLTGHTHEVTSAEFDPTGAFVVTAGGDYTARLWDAETGAMLAILDGHTDWVLAAAFSPDGARVVTASSDGTAKIWSTRGR